MKIQIKKLFNQYWPGLAAIFISTLTFTVTSFINRNRQLHYIGNAFDDSLPFVPFMIVFYVLYYAVWILGYLAACHLEEQEKKIFFIADVITKVVCVIIFLVFPTTNTRPVIEGTDIFSKAVAIIYAADYPTNLFPSHHCLNSWMVFLVLKRLKGIPKWLPGAAFLFAVLVFSSVLLIKQHVWYDVVASVLIAELSYRITRFICMRQVGSKKI